MVGFEVTPVTASSSISRCRPPEWMRSRERLSIQIDCPRSWSACNRDLVILHLLLHRGDLVETCAVPLAAIELGAEEDLDELTRNRRPDDLGAEAEHVHVVVLDRLVSAVEVMADRGANSGHLAGGDRSARAGAADEHPALNG